MVQDARSTQKTGIRLYWPWLFVLAVVAVLNSYVVQYIQPYYFSILMYSGINIILAVSLNLINGVNGQFSMGHAGFMAVGAYISAFITTNYGFDMSSEAGPGAIAPFIFLGALLAGGLGSAAVGYCVGLPSLRLRGDYLAIVTLGFGEIIRVVLLNTQSVGGARGLPGIPPFSTFAWVYGFVVVTVYTVWRIVNSPKGRLLLAIRENEIAAESMGVNTTQGKVHAFMIGAFFAGIAGGLFGHYLQFLSPSIFDFNRSFEIIIMVVLGGMGSITGSVVAAVLLTVMREALRPLQELTQVDYRMVIYSVMLIVLMLSRPYGLFGTKEITDFFGNRRKMKLAKP
jgi:branched-chain amino acid transport system permease protein